MHIPTLSKYDKQYLKGKKYFIYLREITVFEEGDLKKNLKRQRYCDREKRKCYDNKTDRLPAWAKS